MELRATQGQLVQWQQGSMIAWRLHRIACILHRPPHTCADLKISECSSIGCVEVPEHPHKANVVVCAKVDGQPRVGIRQCEGERGGGA